MWIFFFFGIFFSKLNQKIKTLKIARETREKLGIAILLLLLDALLTGSRSPFSDLRTNGGGTFERA